MILFRNAEPSDADKISSLVNSAYRGESSKVGWTTEADFLDGQRTDPEMLREMILEVDSFIELAFYDSAPEEITGCVYLKKDGTSLYLGMLTVKPDLQSKGLGKEILRHVERLALLKECSTIKMTVISIRVELIEFYERRGYRRTGKTESFPENDPRFGLPKLNGLKFIELEKSVSNSDKLR